MSHSDTIKITIAGDLFLSGNSLPLLLWVMEIVYMEMKY